jgi:hypothetical protein
VCPRDPLSKRSPCPRNTVRTALFCTSICVFKRKCVQGTPCPRDPLVQGTPFGPHFFALLFGFSVSKGPLVQETTQFRLHFFATLLDKGVPSVIQKNVNFFLILILKKPNNCFVDKTFNFRSLSLLLFNVPNIEGEFQPLITMNKFCQLEVRPKFSKFFFLFEKPTKFSIAKIFGAFLFYFSYDFLMCLEKMHKFFWAIFFKKENHKNFSGIQFVRCGICNYKNPHAK